jgi:hypothetical protein
MAGRLTLGELIERLEEIRGELGEDVEVRLMTQESWPFENAIAGVVTSNELGDDEDEDEDEDGESAEPTVFIVEGGQLAYGTKRAWEVL